jgi:integrase
MTYIKVKGFKIFQDKKPPYRDRCYHRKTGLKIDLDLAPLGTAAFFAECAKIEAASSAIATKGVKAGTLGALMENYFRQEHFANLADRTKSDYRKVAGFLDNIRDTPLHIIDTPLLTGIHDRATAKIGWRQANYLRTFIYEICRFGIPAGLVEKNFAADVIPKPRPKGLKNANRPWTFEELAFVLENAPPHIAAAVRLMGNTGLDPSDALKLRRDAISDGIIWASRGKTGADAPIPIGEALKAGFAAAPAHDAITILASTKGTPWTYNGFSTVWHRWRQKEVEAGHLPADLTLKGLRHTVSTVLRQSGVPLRQIADLLGQKTESMAAWYSKDANLAERNRGTVIILDAENERQTKSVKLNQKNVKP